MQPIAAAQERVAPIGKPGEGVTVVAADDFSLNLKARVQLRYQVSTPPDAPTDGTKPQHFVAIGTARVYASGNVLSRELQYVLQLAVADRDFRDDARSPIYDAFFDWRFTRHTGVKVGQFFVPFDRLRTTREFALQFAERPRPVAELTLDRDVGFVLHSSALLADPSALTLRVGAFGGAGPNASTARAAGGLLLARLELRPFGGFDDDEEGDLSRHENPVLAAGAALAKNFASSRLRSTTGPTFVGGTTDQSHAAIDLVTKWRGFAIAAEHLWKKSDRDAIVSKTADSVMRAEPTRSAYGWILQASYVFDRPFEVALRASRMTPYSGTDPAFVRELEARGQELAIGVNHYLNGHKFKLQSSCIARTDSGIHLRTAEYAGYVLLDATL